MFDQEYMKLSEAQDFMFYVIPGYKCNLRCDYCFVPKYDTKEISTEVIHAVAYFIKTHIKSKKPTVTILGGEPFLYLERVLEIIKIIKEEVPEVTFYIGSNGNIIKEDQLARIRDLNVKTILMMSIDGKAEAMDTRLNGGMDQVIGQSQRITDIFLSAKEILGRENTEITMTISNKHLVKFDENFAFLVGLNPRLLRYRLASGEKWSLAQVEFYLKVIRKWFFIYMSHKMTNKLDIFPRIEQFEKDFLSIDGQENFYPCSKGLNLTLTPEGRFVPCYNFLDYADQEEYGYEESILDFHKGNFDLEKFQKWRVGSLNLNNEIKIDGELLEARVNYSKCLTKNFNDTDIAHIQNALVHKDRGEREIGKDARIYFQSKYNIDITKV